MVHGVTCSRQWNACAFILGLDASSHPLPGPSGFRLRLPIRIRPLRASHRTSTLDTYPHSDVPNSPIGRTLLLLMENLDFILLPLSHRYKLTIPPLSATTRSGCLLRRPLARAPFSSFRPRQSLTKTARPTSAWSGEPLLLQMPIARARPQRSGLRDRARTPVEHMAHCYRPG